MADAIVKARLVVVLVAMAIETATAEALDSAARWGRVAAQETHAVKAASDSVLLEDAAGRTKLKPWLASGPVICRGGACGRPATTGRGQAPPLHFLRSPCSNNVERGNYVVRGPTEGNCRRGFHLHKV